MIHAAPTRTSAAGASSAEIPTAPPPRREKSGEPISSVQIRLCNVSLSKHGHKTRRSRHRCADGLEMRAVRPAFGNARSSISLDGRD